MLCNLCNKSQATVHLTEIVDEQMSELHLCDDCARKKSMQMEQQFGLSDLLAGLVDYGKQLNPTDKEPVGNECSACGLSYEDFRKIGRLGCGECYRHFSQHLGPLLKRIHGAGLHVGKVPRRVEDNPVKVVLPAEKKEGLESLKEKLVEAIEKEEFEEAARLRDIIRQREVDQTEGPGEKKKGSGRKDGI